MTAPGFFTGLPPHWLPHPAVPVRILVAAHQAFASAIQAIRQSGFNLAKAREEELTHRIYTTLTDTLLPSGTVAGFDSRRFGRVQCSPEVLTHDGTRRVFPDLLLVLLRRDQPGILSSQDGIFTECKPVDGKHAVGAHYCDKGISRFVDGNYAWAMQDGLMVAYVRGARTVASDLTPALAARQGSLGFPAPPSITRSAAIGQGEPLHLTVHRRNFPWPNRVQADPIRLYHSWHKCE